MINCLNFTLSLILGANSFISISVNKMKHSPVTSFVIKLSTTLLEIPLFNRKSDSSMHDNSSHCLRLNFISVLQAQVSLYILDHTLMHVVMWCLKTVPLSCATVSATVQKSKLYF